MRRSPTFSTLALSAAICTVLFSCSAAESDTATEPADSPSGGGAQGGASTGGGASAGRGGTVSGGSGGSTGGRAGSAGGGGAVAMAGGPAGGAGAGGSSSAGAGGAAAGAGGAAGATQGGSAQGGSAQGGSAQGGSGDAGAAQGGAGGEQAGGGGVSGGSGQGGEPSGGQAGAGGATCVDAPAKVGDPLAAIGKCGRLVYAPYQNRGESSEDNRLPDFSFAGYERGGVAIPDVPVVVEVSPASGDRRASIQAAIDEVEKLPVKNGFRGAVLLRKGKYEVDGTLQIRHSGVVLRGEGQGSGGTVLLATRKQAYDPNAQVPFSLIEVQGGGSGLPSDAASTRRITERVGTGATSFAVESTDGYAVGDAILVVRTPNDAWIDALGAAAYDKPWTASSYAIKHERTITAVSGNTVTVDIPIVDPMLSKFGGGEIRRSTASGRIEHVGVEDLRLDSVYAGATDEDHDAVAVRLARASNSWVRRVTALHFVYSAVLVAEESSFNTIEDTAFVDPISAIDGSRRYSFNVESGLGNLFQRCYSRNGRHNFVTGSRVTGPNVWLDCLAEQNHADDGPHHRWATGLLFDNTSSDQLRVQLRLNSGSGHGWAGAQVLLWNGKATSELVCDAPPGAMSWAVGCVGPKVEGEWAPGEPDGIWQSQGTPVQPRSLYIAQLEDRLGAAAVDAVIHPAQKKGRIWKALGAWAGDGPLSSFLP